MRRNDPFEELDRLLKVVSGGFEDPPTAGAVAVDLIEREDAYVVRANLPGYEKEALDVAVEGRTMTIRAAEEGEREAQTDRYVMRERTRRDVSRRVTLPGAVDESTAEATYDAGVLTVTLPKRGGADGHPIDVE